LALQAQERGTGNASAAENQSVQEPLGAQDRERRLQRRLELGAGTPKRSTKPDRIETDAQNEERRQGSWAEYLRAGPSLGPGGLRKLPREKNLVRGKSRAGAQTKTDQGTARCPRSGGRRILWRALARAQTEQDRRCALARSWPAAKPKKDSS
jgi:hypothetical protein